MMPGSFRVYPLLFLIIVGLILLVININCTAVPGFISPPAENQTTKNLISPAYDEINSKFREVKQKLQDVTTAYIDLEKFNWTGLDDVGYWEIQEAGACCLTHRQVYQKNEISKLFGPSKWISLNSTLPSKENTKSLGITIKNSSEFFRTISEALLKALQNESKDSLNISVSEWYKQRNQLSSTLKSVGYQAANFDMVYKSQFDDIRAAFGEASSSTKDRYSNGFNNQSATYIHLLEKIILTLDKAVDSVNEIIDLKP